MWAMLIEWFASMCMSMLGHGIQCLAERAKSVGIDNDALTYLYDLVDSANQNDQLKDGEAKWRWMYGEFESYLTKNGKQVETELIDSLIGVALHHYAHQDTHPIPGR